MPRTFDINIFNAVAKWWMSFAKENGLRGLTANFQQDAVLITYNKKVLFLNLCLPHHFIKFKTRSLYKVKVFNNKTIIFSFLYSIYLLNILSVFKTRPL